MRLKTLYNRFRTWQQNPHHYSDQNMEHHCCVNCGHEYQGNYCPVCGQDAKKGHVTWRAVAEGFMRIWNLDSHSFPVTLWQLLWRPGYLISDYNRGRQQAYHPPINMLFAVAVVYAAFAYLFDFGNDVTVVGVGSFFESALNWILVHPAWAIMTVTMIMILPTWILFRYAPRNAGYTIPENIFVQLYISSLMLLCNLLSQMLVWLILLVPIYYFVTYRQLFGYNFWGTLWRLLVSVVVWLNVIVCAFVLMIVIPDNGPGNSMVYKLMVVVILLAVAAAALFVGYWISRRSNRKGLPKYK